jgi:hypothetical protein
MCRWGITHYIKAAEEQRPGASVLFKSPKHHDLLSDMTACCAMKRRARAP